MSKNQNDLPEETVSLAFFNFRQRLSQIVPPFSHLLLLDWLKQFYRAIVYTPIERLYRRGPALFGVGFWRGVDSSDICAAITGMPASHWETNRAVCEQRISADIDSYVVLLETLLYFYLLYTVGKIVCHFLKLYFRRIVAEKGWINRYSPQLIGWVSHALPLDDGETAPQRCRQKKNRFADTEALKNSRTVMTRSMAMAAATAKESDSSPYNAYAPKENSK